MSLAKVPYERPTVRVLLNSQLAGHELIARRYDTAFLLRLRKGEVKDADLIEEFLAAVVDHTFPLDDLRELDPVDAAAAAAAWIDAVKGTALPPATGRRSAKRSPSARLTVAGR